MPTIFSHDLALRTPTALVAAALLSASTLSATAGTLRSNQVLVVYDSRNADSVAVAEYYAGSDAVPGGAGGEDGAHAGLRAFDIASSGLASSATNGTLFYDAFTAEIRDPIRDHLESAGLTADIRCLVLCKGLPHRVDDADDPGVGDRPSDFGQALQSGAARSVSVDSELTLLWHDLDDIALGAFFTPLAPGYTRNPYWRQSDPINTWTNRWARNDKDWEFIQSRRLSTTSTDERSTTLTPGDIMLVCRLDGNSVDDVRGMIDRAQGIVYDTDTAGFVIDESGSNGVADSTPNSELDNINDPLSRDDDYETTRDILLADGRYDPASVHYDAATGVSNFLVGPNVDFGGQGELITDPLILLTHFGRNHSGRPSTNIDRYEESFNYAPGAIFNTLESYNGRAFNGLGTRFSQGQVADFIEAGGTFGIGMVWEPFAQTLPDSNRLVRNFVLGGLSWAEAAYTAIPCISWQHVVVGDPLARATRTSDDIDGNGRFDIDDLYAFEQNPVDINRDGNADDVDRRLLIDALRVPDRTGRR